MKPKRKQNNTAFISFAQEMRKSKGPNMKWQVCIKSASLKWEKMSLEERQPYHIAAAARRESQTGKTLTGKTLTGKTDSKLTNQEDQQRQMQRNIEQIVRSSSKRAELETQNYCFAMVNYFTRVESMEIYTPAELAAAQFSLSEGVQRVYHTLINPGPNVYGTKNETQQHATATHQLPVPPKAMGETDLKQVHKDLLSFVRSSANAKELPAIYTLQAHIPIVNSTLKFLNSGLATELKIYSIEYLFYIMKEAACDAAGLPPIRSIQVTNTQFELDQYQFESNIGCQYHVEHDLSKYCAKSFVTRWGFMFADYMCTDLAIKLRLNHHMPDRTQITSINKEEAPVKLKCEIEPEKSTEIKEDLGNSYKQEDNGDDDASSNSDIGDVFNTEIWAALDDLEHFLEEEDRADVIAPPPPSIKLFETNDEAIFTRRPKRKPKVEIDEVEIQSLEYEEQSEIDDVQPNRLEYEEQVETGDVEIDRLDNEPQAVVLEEGELNDDDSSLDLPMTEEMEELKLVKSLERKSSYSGGRFQIHITNGKSMEPNTHISHERKSISPQRKYPLMDNSSRSSSSEQYRRISISRERENARCRESVSRESWKHDSHINRRSDSRKSISRYQKSISPIRRPRDFRRSRSKESGNSRQRRSVSSEVRRNRSRNCRKLSSSRERDTSRRRNSPRRNFQFRNRISPIRSPRRDPVRIRKRGRGRWGQRKNFLSENRKLASRSRSRDLSPKVRHRLGNERSCSISRIFKRTSRSLSISPRRKQQTRNRQHHRNSRRESKSSSTSPSRIKRIRDRNFRRKSRSSSTSPSRIKKGRDRQHLSPKLRAATPVKSVKNYRLGRKRSSSSNRNSSHRSESSSKSSTRCRELPNGQEYSPVNKQKKLRSPIEKNKHSMLSKNKYERRVNSSDLGYNIELPVPNNHVTSNPISIEMMHYTQSAYTISGYQYMNYGPTPTSDYALQQRPAMYDVDPTTLPAHDLRHRLGSRPNQYLNDNDVRFHLQNRSEFQLPTNQMIGYGQDKFVGAPGREYAAQPAWELGSLPNYHGINEGYY